MSTTPVEAFGRMRSERRGFDATTTLVDFALVTFDVDPGRLSAALPDGLEPEVRVLDDGRTRGFVSAVSFLDVDFRFAAAPWIKRSFLQTNYRAYVRDASGGPAVYFFGTTLDSPLVVVPRRVWGMPWHGGSTRLDATWVDRVCRTYRHRCSGDWGGVDVELGGTAGALDRLDGFADADDSAHILTHPLDGWFTRPDGRLGRYSVWHSRLDLTLGYAVRSRYAVFEDLGLVAPQAAPHSVLLAPAVEFDVHLPPVAVNVPRPSAPGGRRCP